MNEDQNRFGVTASQINDYVPAANKTKTAEINGVQEVPSSNLGAPTILFPTDKAVVATHHVL